MTDSINKAGNVFQGGVLLVAQADPECWVREGYTVVKSSELEQLRAELDHEIQRSEFYKGEPLRRKGNSVALEQFDKFKAEINANAICKAVKYFETKIDRNDINIADLDEYAEKVRRGEV